MKWSTVVVVLCGDDGRRCGVCRLVQSPCRTPETNIIYQLDFNFFKKQVEKQQKTRWYKLERLPCLPLSCRSARILCGCRTSRISKPHRETGVCRQVCVLASQPGISLGRKSIKERAVLRLIPPSQEIHAFAVLSVITFDPLKGQMTKASHQILLRSPCAGPVKGVRDTQDPCPHGVTS